MRLHLTDEQLEYLIKQRVSLNWSVKKMAEWCGVSLKSIYNFETGKTCSCRLLVYYLHLMDKDDMKRFVTALVFTDSGVSLIG